MIPRVLLSLFISSLAFAQLPLPGTGGGGGGGSSYTFGPGVTNACASGNLCANSAVVGFLNTASTWTALQTFSAGMVLGPFTPVSPSAAETWIDSIYNLNWEDNVSQDHEAISVIAGASTTNSGCPVFMISGTVAGSWTACTTGTSGPVVLESSPSLSNPVINGTSVTGTVTQTIASGTAAMGTGTLTSGTCASAVTVSASGVASTDSISWTPNADISSTTGYSGTSGFLTIYPYPTANNVNFHVCNYSSGSITPSAITLNWRVTR